MAPTHGELLQAEGASPTLRTRWGDMAQDLWPALCGEREGSLGSTGPGVAGPSKTGSGGFHGLQGALRLLSTGAGEKRPEVPRGDKGSGWSLGNMSLGLEQLH